VVFVYTDLYRDAETNDELPEQADKVAWTLRHAGKASLATTCTTALSFFANLASVLRPLREFGMFMGLCVVFAWVMITVMYLPLLQVDSLYFSKCRLRCRSHMEMKHRASEGRSLRSRSFRRCTSCVFKWRLLILPLWLLISLGTIAAAIFNIETDTGVPNLFPEDHNQNYGKNLLEKFTSTADALALGSFDVPKTQEAVCKEHEFRPLDASKCTLFWCEVAASVAVMPENTCQCSRKAQGGFCGSRKEILRVVGPKTFSSADLETMKQYVQTVTGFTVAQIIGSPIEMAPVLLEEWETGQTALKPVTQVEMLVPEMDCESHGICYCGTYVCQPAEGYAMTTETFSLSASSSDNVGRRLIPHLEYSYTGPIQIASGQRASVEVIWGISTKPASPLLGEPEPTDRWEFLPSFDLRQPWAQRNIYTFCTSMPAQMKVTGRWCWLEDFRNTIVNSGGRFPLLQSDFEPAVQRYLISGLTGVTPSKEFIWDIDGTIKAMYARFETDHYKHSQSGPAIAFKKLWDVHLLIWNEEASRFGRGAWHTADLWVRAEASAELIKSTIITLGLVIVLSFIGMMVFTMDAALSSFVVMATLGVICFLAFFITTLMGWEIGPIEVIALIVFLGYAVTYSLHVTHKYEGHEALKMARPTHREMSEGQIVRYQRVFWALKSIGGAALGSAITTIGCSIFLVFCTLTIFQKLGGVVLIVTLVSITTALCPLPALLLVIGPVHPGLRSMRECPNACLACLRCACCRSRRITTDDESSGVIGRQQQGPPVDTAASHVVPAPSPALGAHGKVEVENIHLAEKAFDIGEESPLEPIWARDIEKTNRARPAAGIVQLGPKTQSPPKAPPAKSQSPKSAHPKYPPSSRLRMRTDLNAVHMRPPERG